MPAECRRLFVPIKGSRYESASQLVGADGAEFDDILHLHFRYRADVQQGDGLPITSSAKLIGIPELGEIAR